MVLYAPTKRITINKITLLLAAFITSNGMGHLPQLPLIPEPEDLAPVAIAIVGISTAIVIYCISVECALKYRKHDHKSWRKKYYSKTK